MFSLVSHPRVRLSGPPQAWGTREVSEALNHLDHRRAEDRKAVETYLRSVEISIEKDIRAPQYASVQEVLQEKDIGKLPIQLKLYQGMHRQLSSWLG